MIDLPGYEIDQKIYEGLKTAVYRGTSNRQEQSVIIKVLKAEYPSIEQIASLRQEYAITQDLNCEGVVKYYALENYRHSFALILEDFGGQSLNQLLKTQTLSILDFLVIAISLTQTIIELHQVPIIHKDIKPSNIIINLETKQIKLTDFNIASRLKFEQQNITNPHLLQGTFAYMSPEQTGRMNRAIDYRSDFYSLGVTFYEMLTGTLPFSSTDPMELVHCHIAKQPPALEQFNIPPTIANIVMKLMAKNAEDRYQSGAGLKFDLETCLSQLQNKNKIELFTLGECDRRNQLLIPQKLYGRKKEVASLLASFNRVASNKGKIEDQSPSKIEVTLVSGYSGIGKTSIVNEVHKAIVEAQGFFIKGKFEQFKRNIPYAALIQAFQALIRQLLTEKEEQITFWQDILLKAIAPNAQIIIDVIPEVELIIGEQPAVAKLGSLEAENRFNRVFQQFISVFCQPDRPLVIFLDDLQWADAASLKLLQLLITDGNSKHLFIIGAYRDNEVSSTHPLTLTLEKIKTTETAVNHIKVQPLSYTHVQQLIEETIGINVDLDRLKLLAELIFNKTQGNPFFISQLLKTLCTEKLINYQVSTNIWQWNIEEIQAIGITDFNIVELIARNIGKLPTKTREILKLAACIGDFFSLELLTTVNQKSTLSTSRELWIALQEGLILPQSESYKIPLVFAETESPKLKLQDIKVQYKFLHDRVQQAAYSLIPDSERKATHLKIGKLLLEQTNLQEQQKNIFVLVNQLNFGIDLLRSTSEKEELCRLNLIAGQKAKSATAYEASINYLHLASQLLAPDSWQNQYELTFNVYLELAEAEYLNSNLKEAADLCDLALLHIQNNLDRVRFYEIKIKINLAKSEINIALDNGQKALQLLEVSLLKSPPQELNLEKLAALAPMKAPDKLMAMQILNLIFAPACFGESSMALTILYTMIELSRQYGNSPPVIYAYASYGSLVAWLLLDIDLAYQLGQLSLLVLDKLNSREFWAKAYVSISINQTYKKHHIKETLEPLQQSIQNALEVGDLEFACHAANFYCEHLLFVGANLTFVHSNQKRYITFINKLQQEHPLFLTKIGAQFVNILLNESSSKNLIGDILDEREALPYLLKTNNLISIFNIYFYKAWLCYLVKDYSQAIKNSEIAIEYSGFIKAEVIFTEHNFCYSLALLSQYPRINTKGQQKYFEQVQENQKLMGLWKDHAPMNFQHKYDLVEAEKARVLSQPLAAMEYYDRAIAGARKQEYIQHEALANELAAAFYLALEKEKITFGREEIGKIYLRNAHHCYLRWGAKAKVKQLEAEYPQYLLGVRNKSKSQRLSTSISTTESDGTILDLTTVIKAYQAISGEIKLEKLLQNLMKIAIENAGAQTGFLILNHEGNWVIEAQGTVDSDRVTILQSIPLESVDPQTSIPLN